MRTYETNIDLGDLGNHEALIIYKFKEDSDWPFIQAVRIEHLSDHNLFDYLNENTLEEIRNEIVKSYREFRQEKGF